MRCICLLQGRCMQSMSATLLSIACDRAICGKQRFLKNQWPSLGSNCTRSTFAKLSSAGLKYHTQTFTTVNKGVG
jgi:hypothetical protein